MPYKLRKCPRKDLYWVVGEDGEHHSKEPMPMEKARRQMTALNIAHVPLGPINIPDILSIGPSFVVRVTADISSSENALLSSGFMVDVPPFDAQLFHFGDKNRGADYSQLGNLPYNPQLIQLPTQVKLADIKKTFDIHSNFQANFTITPQFLLGLTVCFYF